MNEINLYLTEDAECAIKRQVASIYGEATLVEAFIGWLFDGYPDIDLESIVKSTITKTGAARTYREIAVMGYLVSMFPQQIESHLKEGLLWMCGRNTSHLPDYAIDGLALLGLAQGFCACTGWEDFTKVKEWLDETFKKSSKCERLNDWEKSLIIAANSLAISLNKKLSLSQSILPDLQVALASKGFCDVDEEIEKQALNIILSSKKLEQEIERSATQLAVLRYLKQKTPTILPGRATIENVCMLLKSISSGLRRWCWEEKARSKRRNAEPIKWDIQNEYHVQDLLWFLLSPIFPDLEDEENLPSLGPKHPRCDLGIPSLALIIEVKFVYDGIQSEFADIVEGVAADTSLYLSERSGYRQVLAFVWDNSRKTEQHAELLQGLRKIRDVVDAIIVPRPGKMG